jgi:hypothetical protein
MKTKTTFRMMFFIMTACLVLSCKQSNNDSETEAIDSTAVSTEPDTMNSTIPDTTAPANQTATDTLSQRPADGSTNPNGK